MFYPWLDKQTRLQYILNTIDLRFWFRKHHCECCWQVFQGHLMWIPQAGCDMHD